MSSMSQKSDDLAADVISMAVAIRSARRSMSAIAWSFICSLVSSAPFSDSTQRHRATHWQHVICAPATISAWLVPNLRAQQNVLSSDALHVVAFEFPTHRASSPLPPAQTNAAAHASRSAILACSINASTLLIVSSYVTTCASASSQDFSTP